MHVKRWAVCFCLPALLAWLPESICAKQDPGLDGPLGCGSAGLLMLLQVIILRKGTSIYTGSLIITDAGNVHWRKAVTFMPCSFSFPKSSRCPL